MNEWKGELAIKSTLGKGTTVEITLPRIAQPSWCVPEINISAGSPVVVLDDDPSIHQIWADRFESLGIKQKGIKLLHFSLAKDLLNWSSQNPNAAKTIYLCDQELLGQNHNGLQVIEELGIEKQSVLVTSRYDDKEIRLSCAGINVPLIPKAFAGFVPIVIN